MKQIYGLIFAGLINLSDVALKPSSDILNTNNLTTIIKANLQNSASTKNTNWKNDSVRNKIYPYKDFKPTTKGIDAYVKDQTEAVISDFESFFNIKITNMSFETDNLTNYVIHDDFENDSTQENNTNENNNNVNNNVNDNNNELGIYFYGENYAVISNEEKYIGYSLKNTQKKIIANTTESNKFVRAVMIHELAHDYFKQVIDELRYEKTPVEKEYYMINHETAGSRFIEEAVAEYCSTVMNELIIIPKIKTYTPKNVQEILDEKNKYNIYYKYGSIYISDILENKNLRTAIKILVTNPAPSLDEILMPEKYFTRLNKLK
jgi:hypothetical protein